MSWFTARWLLASVCLVALSTSNGQSQGPSAQQIALQGRFSPGLNNSSATALPQTFSWPASSVFASFEGATSVTIGLAAIPPNGSLTYAINWFRFAIDGKAVTDGFTTYNQLALNVTLNVTSASHTLRITKMNDGAKGEAVLQSIALSNGGRFLASSGVPSQVAERKMLILGDSYAVGYGNAGAGIPGTCIPSPRELPDTFVLTCEALQVRDSQECADLWRGFNQNGLEAFGPAAAEAFGADYQVLATSGSGMVGYSFAADVHPDLPPAEYEAILPSNEALFNRSIYSDASSQYPVSSWVPQVVLVSSGTNDWHSVPPLYTLTDWLSDATAFLQQISSTFNQPAIIIQSWPPEQQLAGALDGVDAVNETIQYIQAMPSLYTEAVQKKIPNVHYLQLNTENYDNFYAWCDHHPSAVADRAVAAQLVSFVEAVAPGWNTTGPVSLNVDQQAIRPSTALYESAGGIPSAG